jgi:hypothetical protein
MIGADDETDAAWSGWRQGILDVVVLAGELAFRLRQVHVPDRDHQAPVPADRPYCTRATTRFSSLSLTPAIQTVVNRCSWRYRTTVSAPGCTRSVGDQRFRMLFIVLRLRVPQSLRRLSPARGGPTLACSSRTRLMKLASDASRALFPPEKDPEGCAAGVGAGPGVPELGH